MYAALGNSCTVLLTRTMPMVIETTNAIYVDEL